MDSNLHFLVVRLVKSIMPLYIYIYIYIYIYNVPLLIVTSTQLAFLRWMTALVFNLPMYFFHVVVIQNISYLSIRYISFNFHF